MSECLTANTTLDVATLEVGVDFTYFVKVTHAAPNLKVTFAPQRTGTMIGSVDGVLVSPTGPTCGADWVEFTTDHLGTTYTVEVSYSDPHASGDAVTPPLDTPTKSPKFKPQTSCPTGAP